MVRVEEEDLTLMMWDLFGEDDFQKLRLSYFRGASGLLVVADGTRRATVDAALRLHEKVVTPPAKIPSVLVLNKSDLAEDWQVTPKVEEDLARRGWKPIRSSTKTGAGVEEAFHALGKAMLAG